MRESYVGHVTSAGRRDIPISPPTAFSVEAAPFACWYAILDFDVLPCPSYVYVYYWYYCLTYEYVPDARTRTHQYSWYVMVGCNR